MRQAAILLLLALFGGCSPPEQPAIVSQAGLVELPCASSGPIRPVAKRYCTSHRNFVTPRARAALVETANAFASKHPGAAMGYMEASWPQGTRPMPPHLSHGDGRQIDLALQFATQGGQPLTQPPKDSRGGYGAFEPPRRESERVCVGVDSPHDKSDPPADRTWRLDDDRTRDMLALLVADPRVRRVFIEPHLKSRLGFTENAKVRFAGCQAARHDDHVHVDFF